MHAMTHQPELAPEVCKARLKSADAKDPFIQTYVSFDWAPPRRWDSDYSRQNKVSGSLALADADGNFYIAILSLVNLADVLYLQARLFDAENVCKQALKTLYRHIT